MFEEYDTYEERKYIILIIYDISDNKQRLRISKYLQTFGVRVQKSAFEARLNQKQFQRLLDGLRIKLQPEDNVRIYKLHGYEEIEVFGTKDYLEEEDVIII